MLTRMRPARIAGALSLLAAVLVGAIWYLYLFVAPIDSRLLATSAVETLRYTFSPENEERWWFASLMCIFLGSAALGSAYLLNVASSRPRAVVLLSLSVLVAVAAFAVADWALALFVALPVVWGYRCVHGT